MTRADKPILATAIRERWRQCSECFESWEEEPERSLSRCPACASLTTLDERSLFGRNGIHADAAAATQHAASSELYFSLHGRISRSTWWLKIYLPCFASSLLALLISLTVRASSEALGYALMGICYLIFGWIFTVGGVKRWHDHDYSGWWMLVIFVPIFGGLWNLYVCALQRGTRGPNRFGPDPVNHPRASA